MNKKLKIIIVLSSFVVIVAAGVVIWFYARDKADSKSTFEEGVMNFVDIENDSEPEETTVSDNTVSENKPVISPDLINEETNLPYVATQQISDEIEDHKSDAKSAEDWVNSMKDSATYDILLPIKDYMTALQNEYAELNLSYIDDAGYYLSVYIDYAVAQSELATYGSVAERRLYEVSIEDLFDGGLQHVMIQDTDGNLAYEIYILKSNGRILVFQK